MRASSHAPAVRYPHGQSARVGWLLATVSSCGLACLLAWLVFGTARADIPIKAVTGLGLWLACCLIAWRWWARMPVGQLAWDGGQWLLESGMSGQAQAVQGSPQVHLDLQWGMLVRLQGVSRAPAQWLWLRNAMAPADWALLRAVLHWSQRSQPADGEAR